MRIFTTALLCGLIASISALAPAGQADKRLDIYWVDTEGGAATLVVTPSGESLLFDAGNPGRRDSGRIFDVAAKVAMLRQIDHLVITHYHADHFGGAADLIKLMPIKKLYDNGEFAEQRDGPDKTYKEIKVDRTVISPGDMIELKATAESPKLSVKCLAARQKFIPAPSDAPAGPAHCASARAKDRDGSDNANSIVSLVEFGDFRFFDAGDLTWNMEQKLVCPKNLVGTVDVYQVTHHGLDASNNPLVLAALRPTIAMMNNGPTKGCEPETFATLKETDSIKAIYQLHKNLKIEKNNVAPEFIANTEKECKASYIKLSVAPDGKSYTISIPATKHEQTYETRKHRE